MSNNFQPPNNPRQGANRWQSTGQASPDALPPSAPPNAPRTPQQGANYRNDARWSQPPAQPQQSFGEVVPYTGHAPQPQFHSQGIPASQDMSAPRKSKTVAIVLSLPFIVGALGLHNFYLGHTLRGVLHLVLVVLAFFPIIGWWVVAPLHLLWILVELVLVIAGAGDYGHDKQGRPLV